MEHTRAIGHEELLENLGWVQVLARRLVGDAAGDDVGQDVWVKALERPPRERSGPGLRAWLASVPRTLARQDARSDARRGQRELRAARPEELPSTADVVERGEAQRLVTEAVMELGEPARSAVLLRYLDGLSAVQIAARLGEDPAAVRKRLSRALETLRARLERRLGGRRELVGALLPLAVRGGGRAGVTVTVKSLVAVGAVAAVALVASAVLWIGARSREAESTPAASAVIAASSATPTSAATGRPEATGGQPGAGEAPALGGAVAPANPGAPLGADPRPRAGSLLAGVPDDAYALLHVLDPAALRARAERNDWVATCASPDGEPALRAVERWYEGATETDFDGLIEVALGLSGEAVLFFTGECAGFLTEPPADRAALAGVLDGWLTDGGRRSLEVAGARVQLGSWSEILGESSARSGSLLAFLDHPAALGLFSGASEEAVVAALTASLGRLGPLANARRAPVVEGYLAAGGGAPRGVEGFVDFTPLVPIAEEALRRSVEGVVPDPTGLLGLERGTWLFVSADVFPGTHVDVRARLHVPEGTLAARLADTFEPLPRTLPADLPRGAWATWALDWNLGRFFATARAELERAHEEGLPVVDGGLAAAQAMSGVDPIEDVIDQFSGLFAWYHVLDAGEPLPAVEHGFGFLAGLVDGDHFLDAFEALLAASGTDLGLDAVELEGAETYLLRDDEGADGGLAILPDRMLASLSRATLVRGLRALARAEGAGLSAGSLLQAAFDENPGACAFAYAELAHVRTLDLLGAAVPPPPQPGRNDPFDSQVIFAADRTADGFALRLYTR